VSGMLADEHDLVIFDLDGVIYLIDKPIDGAAAAVERLRLLGVEGPYALCVGPDIHARIIEAHESGYLLLDHLGKILGGDVIWTPGLEGAVVLTQRGGDFTLTVGQDLSIGYLAHNADTVTLYLQESLTFLAYTAEAVVNLS